MTDLAKCTWPEAARLFDARTVALLPIGSTEPHGPHLPLDTDVTIALAQARRAAERLERAGVPAVVLPAIPYGLTRYTEGFPGAVTLQPGTLWSLLDDVVIALEQQGLRQIVFSNGHLEPAHLEILRGVAGDHPERGPFKAQILFPDNTRRRFAATLGNEFRSGDCHAGSYESSLVMAFDPAAVRESERRALPAVQIGLLEKMRAGVASFQAAGATQAYCGDPAQASAAEGQRLADALADMIVDCVREAWPDLFA
jgi:creatinine amidohydrolase